MTGGREYLNCSFPAPCRVCGGPSWKEDADGSVHPCCVLHGGNCLACRGSATLNRDQRRRKLPRQIIDDKLGVIGEGKSLQEG